MIIFEQALTNHSKKQAYLDQIPTHESVEALVYDPQWEQRIEYEEKLIKEGIVPPEIRETRQFISKAYFIVLFSPKILGAGGSHPIFVSNYGFEKMQTEPNFLSAVLDHEAYHTDELMNGMQIPNGVIDYQNIDQVNPQIVMNLREFNAGQNQLEHLAERGCGRRFREWIEMGTQAHERNLRQIIPTNDLERQALGYK